ncbi:23S rRNA (guanosine(2251)-2'-O)-methyltransferase RlmB [Anaerocolumna sedimenticola]|uniref:23S rRNA (Guanosine(2251)-2'-O)-methyltransferase RlmB n=1 Tax=Anaerocolumna sedimenticola TaxID=2696063 RepID=A0A6P1THV0_9FIRM|nr:RNA methyltransferase [Anaerocolumna sedimenticola]QHQ59877.1 23S rRNA (guanosine(2251)-2'-O)-methyltransferase RlmB [Anaerocolumna sedimenticola]
MITSSSNSQIKNIIQLQKKSRARTEQGAFVTEGTKMFEESKDGGYLIKAYVSESFYNEQLTETPDYFKGFPYEVVADGVLKEASDTLTPQGVMAIVKKPVYDLDKIITGQQVNLLLLEDIRDPGNLGTIIRTAEGAGITGIILSKTSVDMYNPKVIRSTMGAIYRMPFIYAEDFKNTLIQIKRNDISIYAAHLNTDFAYDDVNYPEKCAILIGNEANGLSDEIAGMSDQYIKIPMEGSVESLNAAIAAAILMYEVYRQRRKNKVIKTKK